MSAKRKLTAILFFAFSAALFAQEKPRGHDPIAEHIFPPELVMQNQQAIGLSNEQKTSIKEEVRTAQGKFTDLQWDMQDEMETFIALLSQEKIDEKRALAQLEKVLKLETEIKRTHLTLGIRIKNLLQPEQQAQLRKMREETEPN